MVLGPRKVQGRKGIGKFGVFGIAERIAIRTVGTDNGDVAHFALDFPNLTASPNFIDENGYPAEKLPDDGMLTEECPGHHRNIIPIEDQAYYQRGAVQKKHCQKIASS